MSKRFLQAVSDLIYTTDFRGDFILHPMEGGANNRVFRVEIDDSCMLLKEYFQHKNDQRDRLNSEFSFSRFAWDNGLRSLPQPFGCDQENRLGLYEFVQGRQLLPHEINENVMQQALNFYFELNQHKRLPRAKGLPIGSEACFSIAEHLQCLEYRLQRLSAVERSSDITCQAALFIQDELIREWRRVSNSIRKHAGKLGLALDAKIPWQDWCLSPSDFGFHNSILCNDGRLRFIDFEYAGWDDPAKTVCDFFCQPSLPVPLDYFNMFVEGVVSDLSEPQLHLQRIALLLPVYRLKWCCILLNDFLPDGSQRRRFANRAIDSNEQKRIQLQKAIQAFERTINN